MNPFSLNKSSSSRRTISNRCLRDEATEARLKYRPWYHHIERQEGVYVWLDGQKKIMMSSNDYLGLSEHPKIIEAAVSALKEWGSSTTGARLANGSRSYHRDLEKDLAQFLGKEDTLVLNAGYLACMAAVSTFAQKGDYILVDRNVHSSLWSGIVLSGGMIERFAHNKPSDLQDVLTTIDKDRPKMVVIEGVYSMEGHITPLQEIVELCQPYGCFIVLDDAHGLGVLGDRGQGTAGYLDRTKETDIICGSLSKSLASTGGFIAGSKGYIEYLRTHSKQSIFSAAISPSQAAVARMSLKIIQSEPEHRERLWENTRYFKRHLERMDIDFWDSQTPAVPIILGNKERTFRVWKYMMKAGVFSVLAISPAVPPGKDLLRMAVSARHSQEDLDFVLETLETALKKC